MTDIIYHRTDCRACGSHDLELVFSLKPSPIGDAYVTREQLEIFQPSYPIDLYQCRQCGLAQITDVIDPEVLYGDYIYVTGSSMGLAAHFRDYAQSVASRLKLTPGERVVDLGSNDGTLLGCFKQLGMQVLGVEPATHIALQATAGGIQTIGAFFTPELAREMVAEHGYARLVTANNVFANIDDLQSWVQGIDLLLAADGVFVFESYYLADLLQNKVFDFIYHEHLCAFSVKPVAALFERIGLRLIAVERVATKGGSLRYFVQRSTGSLQDDGSVAEMLAHEHAMGLYRKQTYSDFAEEINALKTQTRNFLLQAKREGKSIAGFGASITGTTLIYHFEIGELLDYLVDDNPAKQGRFSPGLHLPVYPCAVLEQRKPDYVLILAWRFAGAFISKQGLKHSLIIPVPEFKVLVHD